MNKLKIFLSSRVNSAFTGLDEKFTLQDLRAFLRKELELATFLDEKLLEVVINELNFKSTIAKNAFDNCMDKMRSCNIIIILYNGQAGWSVTGNDTTNGICHEEFLVAASDFSDMTFAVNLSHFFEPETDPEEIKKNEAFKNDINSSFPHMETISAKTIGELKANVLTQVKQYILTAIEKSFETQKEKVSGSGVFGATLNWSKMSYSEREMALKSGLDKGISAMKEFKGIVKAYHAVPDNMSVADARNMIGRPFIDEHTLIENVKEKSGVIHFIGVYGNATEVQVKNLVGYPDLAVIKAPFGFYLWEKNMQIQMFFLVKCINPNSVGTRISELINWLSGSREGSKITARAKARFLVLDAVNKAAKVPGI